MVLPVGGDTTLADSSPSPAAVAFAAATAPSSRIGGLWILPPTVGDAAAGTPVMVASMVETVAGSDEFRRCVRSRSLKTEMPALLRAAGAAAAGVPPPTSSLDGGSSGRFLLVPDAADLGRTADSGCWAAAGLVKFACVCCGGGAGRAPRAADEVAWDADEGGAGGELVPNGYEVLLTRLPWSVFWMELP